MARPTKLNDIVTGKICDALRIGSTRRAAARYAGISEDSLGRYMGFAGFAEAIKKAEAECEVAMAANIQKAALGYDVVKTVTRERLVKGVLETETTVTLTHEFCWQASAWWLERRRPDDYARFVLDPSKLSNEQIVALLGRHG